VGEEEAVQNNWALQQQFLHSPASPVADKFHLLSQQADATNFSPFFISFKKEKDDTHIIFNPRTTKLSLVFRFIWGVDH
jgi:hypothetical protein